MTSWVYEVTDRSCADNNYITLYTVGFYDPDGKWHPESDHQDANKAAERCHYLNGGKGAA